MVVAFSHLPSLLACLTPPEPIKKLNLGEEVEETGERKGGGRLGDQAPASCVKRQALENANLGIPEKVIGLLGSVTSLLVLKGPFMLCLVEPVATLSD